MTSITIPEQTGTSDYVGFRIAKDGSVLIDVVVYDDSGVLLATKTVRCEANGAQFVDETGTPVANTTDIFWHQIQGAQGAVDAILNTAAEGVVTGIPALATLPPISPVPPVRP